MLHQISHLKGTLGWDGSLENENLGRAPPFQQISEKKAFTLSLFFRPSYLTDGYNFPASRSVLSCVGSTWEKPLLMVSTNIDFIQI